MLGSGLELYPVTSTKVANNKVGCCSNIYSNKFIGNNIMKKSCSFKIRVRIM
jgi:hypothetical protein